MKRMVSLLTLATVVAFSTLAVSAADETKARPIPFRGKIATVDKQAKTVKVGERTFHITSDSKLTKAGKPATLDDAAVGEEVGGAYKEGTDKKMEIVSLRIGPRPDAPPKKDDKK
jgi:hypothetical protein